MDSFSGVVIVCLLWLAREVGAIVLQTIAARRGRFGYVIGDMYFVRTLVEDDGTQLKTIYVPTPNDPQNPFPHVVFYGSFFNETATPVMLRDFKITFFGVEGGRIIHSNPAVFIGGQSGSVCTIPAHGHSDVRVFTSVNGSELATTYAGVVPVLEAKTTGGRLRHFALTHGGFWGEEIVAWDSRRKRVVKGGSRAWISLHTRRT